MTNRTSRAANHRDNGFSLVELVIAVAIVALISLSLVPLLVNGVKQSAANTTMATATLFANQQIETAATQPTTCSHFNDSNILTALTKVDPRGVTLVITNSVAACPTGFPSSRVFTSTVTRQDTGAVLITAKTLVYVSGS